ncbi:MAG: flagellar export chaperone FliS [Thermanaeromonas sp.]|uniref:flagellar export chaperone FliS n=1 Tax=Thermanaeromonas sp. TaxID=2003697 RepID=UPI00243B7CB6|nr:flagellar export chaperone FliS [Thermanaeromonas sp.]MCG0278386.1 flagellar export chaperone FliS [Thermanaeromonas sp.]
MLNNPYRAYQTNQVFTLPQEKLVLMLYDGLLRFCREGLTGIQAKDYEKAHESLIRAQEILAELMAGLNFEAGEIAQRLYQLYEFMHRHLIQANIKKDAGMIREVIDLLQDLRDTWEEATRRYHSHDYRTRVNGLDVQR